MEIVSKLAFLIYEFAAGSALQGAAQVMRRPTRLG